MSQTTQTALRTRRMTYAALYLAIAMVLPFITGQIPSVGNALSPMHLPVLLCGFMCGWPWGLLVGFIAPLLRSVIFGMPPMFPTAVSMAFELATYGAVAGWLHRRLPRTMPWLYVVLVSAMLVGRVVWAAARLVLSGLGGSAFDWNVFLSEGFVKAVPAIILQLALIPVLVMAMERAGLSLNQPEPKA